MANRETALPCHGGYVPQGNIMVCGCFHSCQAGVVAESGIVVRTPMAPSIAAHCYISCAWCSQWWSTVWQKGSPKSGGQGKEPTFLWPLTKAKNLCFPSASACTFQIECPSDLLSGPLHCTMLPLLHPSYSQAWTN